MMQYNTPMIFRNESIRRRAKTNAITIHRAKTKLASRKIRKAICGECGEPCEIPFEPKEGRPGYCKVCFLKRRGKNIQR